MITVLERSVDHENGGDLDCPFQDTFGCINSQLEEILSIPEEGLDEWLRDT